MSALEVIFEDNIKLTEDEVVLAMFQNGETSLKDCQAEYRRLATEAGLIITPAQRKTEWDEKVADIDLSSSDDIEFAKAAGKELGITNVTIGKYLKAIAEEQGVELPANVRSSKWKEIVDAFDKEEALDGNKADVIAKIAEVGECDEKKATSQYNRLRKAFGWEAPASMSSQLNDWFVDNLEASKDDILEKGIELGMTEGSATYYVGVYKIVVELLAALNDK